MEKIVIFFLIALIVLSPFYFGPGFNSKIEGAVVFPHNKNFPICISFANNSMKDGWTPVSLTTGEITCHLWIDSTGRVMEFPWTDAQFIEPVCMIDLPGQNLRSGTDVLHFDVYEQTNARTRWKLSQEETTGMLKKILFREKDGIDLYLGTFRLHLKHMTWDFSEFSPGLSRVQLHGPIPIIHQPLIYEKNTDLIYSNHEWYKKLISEKNCIQAAKTGTGTLSSAAISTTERAALIALYNNTNGDYWFNNAGWKTPPLDADGFALPGMEYTWYGITCDTANTTVQAISLEMNNLSGIIPPEIEDLANLQYLGLSGNWLSGPIPPELGNLINLQWLGLDWNQLSGDIPPEMGNLVNLQYFCIYSNQLSGTIPSELGRLTNLYWLDLGWNYLSGQIPHEIGNMSNLQWLSFCMNFFDGTIPPELGNLAKLQNLWIFDNQLSGTIPPQLGKLGNLQCLLIGLNRLSGKIPAELGDLANLQILFIFATEISGTIPGELGQIANLQFLWLASNQLTGIIPPELGNLTNLKILWLSSNRLYGSIPSNLINLNNLLDDWSNLKWNALHTGDETLKDLLNAGQTGGNWENTQTIAPANVTAISTTTTSIDIHWTPIIYKANTGGYRVFYSAAPGGPYTFFGMTADKNAPGLTVNGLRPGTPYYFVVQTRTNPHIDNFNTVDSQYSAEISTSTLYPLILTSPNGTESWGLRTIRNVTWTSFDLSGNIHLELWKGEKKFGNIALNIPIAIGNYSWGIADNFLNSAPPGNDYKIKIITRDGLYHDMSNANFSIVEPFIKLTSPKGGEAWKLGSKQNITWSSLGLTGKVKFLLFKNNVQVGVIDKGFSIDNGNYTWTVGKLSRGTATASSNYSLKICLEDNPFYSSRCGTFKIL